MTPMQKITPFLWFDTQLEEAVNFYVSIFPDSRIVNLYRMGEGGPVPKDTVFTATFELSGQRFMALNGGPHYKFNEAISLYVDVATQAELDGYWNKLLEGGTPQMCGWLKDRYGLSWQIIPSVLSELLYGTDRVKAQRVMQAMLKMVKLDIEALKNA